MAKKCEWCGGGFSHMSEYEFTSLNEFCSKRCKSEYQSDFKSKYKTDDPISDDEWSAGMDGLGKEIDDEIEFWTKTIWENGIWWKAPFTMIIILGGGMLVMMAMAR